MEFYSLESMRRFIPLAMGLGTGQRQLGFTVSQGARSFLSLLVVLGYCCFSISSSGTKLRMLGLVHIVKTIKKLIGMIAGQFSLSLSLDQTISRRDVGTKFSYDFTRFCADCLRRATTRPRYT